MDLAIQIASGFSIFFSLAALACGIVALRSARDSAPAQLLAEMAQLKAAYTEVREAVQNFEQTRVAFRIEIDSLIESVEGVLDQVERKRRSIAASAAKIAAANPAEETAAPEMDLTTRRGVELRARQTGLYKSGL